MMIFIVIGTVLSTGLLVIVDPVWSGRTLGFALIAYAAYALFSPTLSVSQWLESWLSPFIGIITGVVPACLVEVFDTAGTACRGHPVVLLPTAQLAEVAMVQPATTAVVLKQSTGSRNWRCEMRRHQGTRPAIRRRFASTGAPNRSTPTYCYDLVMETCNV
ncbi:hypothetical protein SB861_32915 [Paraburkholderia sp. SIMBA_049]